MAGKIYYNIPKIENIGIKFLDKRMNRPLTEGELLEVIQNLLEIGDLSDVSVFKYHFWAIEDEYLKIYGWYITCYIIGCTFFVVRSV